MQLSRLRLNLRFLSAYNTTILCLLPRLRKKNDGLCTIIIIIIMIIIINCPIHKTPMKNCKKEKKTTKKKIHLLPSCVRGVSRELIELKLLYQTTACAVVPRRTWRLAAATRVLAIFFHYVRANCLAQGRLRVINRGAQSSLNKSIVQILVSMQDSAELFEF